MAKLFLGKHCTLAHLTENNARNCEIVVENGGFDLVVQQLRSSRHHVNWQVWSYRWLVHLMEQNTEVRVKMATQTMVNMVLGDMKLCISSVDMHRYGCRVLALVMSDVCPINVGENGAQYARVAMRAHRYSEDVQYNACLAQLNFAKKWLLSVPARTAAPICL